MAGMDNVRYRSLRALPRDQRPWLYQYWNAFDRKWRMACWMYHRPRQAFVGVEALFVVFAGIGVATLRHPHPALPALIPLQALVIGASLAINLLPIRRFMRTYRPPPDQ